jgi:hypothetical protein
MLGLVDRVREKVGLPDYSLYLVNDVDPAVNKAAIRNIKDARAALDVPIDKVLRKFYEYEMLTTLPSIAFNVKLFDEIRQRAIVALSDRELSPCAYLSGDQAEKQGIPRGEIPHDLRCYTTNVEAAIPDAPALIDDKVTHFIRSCIGSNFSLCDITLTRNYHVPLELSAKYDLLSDRWHFDHKYLDILYLFVTLSHVALEDGPTHAISAPDSRALLGLGFKCDLRDQDPNGGVDPVVIDKMPSLTRCVGPPGTMLMAHTSLCLHKAGAPQPGRVRDIMLFSFRHSARMDISSDAMKRPTQTQ